MTIYALEYFHWYEGGSGIDLYFKEAPARAILASLTKNHRKWKQYGPGEFCPDGLDAEPESDMVIETWANAGNHTAILLHKLQVS